jgi:hypothetical protein
MLADAQDMQSSATPLCKPWPASILRARHPFPMQLGGRGLHQPHLCRGGALPASLPGLLIRQGL